MDVYRHTQIGWTILVALGVPLVLTLGVLAVAPMAAIVFVAVVAAAVVLAVCLALVPTLTTTVDPERVEVRFGPGLLRRRIPLRELRSVTVVRNPWYYGWGIRWTPHGWLWNVSGSSAVELAFQDGRRFRIGSDEPESLAAAIRERIASA